MTAPMQARIKGFAFADGAAGVIPVDLCYDPADPYALSVTFEPDVEDGEPQNRWVVARDLLSEGTRRPAGVGDMRLRPRGGWVAAILDSPAGGAVVLLERLPLAGFLYRTYEAVPAGTESGHLDVDGAIGQLLGGVS